mgnify:CR=1 FL=1
MVTPDSDILYRGGTEAGDIGHLRQIAGRFCPDEVRQEVSQIVLDEVDAINLKALEEGFLRLLQGRNGFPNEGIPTIGNEQRLAAGSNNSGNTSATFSNTANKGWNNGEDFGIGIPERDLASNLHYIENDTINVQSIRKDFPILGRKVHGKDLVWFDNGATTQKPKQVIDTISDYYTNYNSNIHRGAHTLAAEATDAYEDARQTVADFINAQSPEEIIFVRGTTEGINLVAQTFGRKFLNPGDEVIVSTLDHHANIVPWQQVSKERGATLKAIPINRNGDLILEDFDRMIGKNTKFVSVGHVNNTFGTINNIEHIIEVAHRHNVPVLIDGAQSIAHSAVDVQKLDADFFVFSGHKIYGPNGIGVVYGKKKWLDLLPPWQGGGNMIKDVTIEETQFNAPPARFEAGTPNVADAIGLGAALKYVKRIGIPAIEAYEHDLTEYARQQLGLIPGVTLLGNPKKRVSVVSFVVDNIEVPEMGTLLDQEGIAVRAGHHCAQPALRSLGYEMSVRPTFSFYNTKEEIDKLVIAVKKIIQQHA